MSYEMRITRAATSGAFSLAGLKSSPMLEAQTIRCGLSSFRTYQSVLLPAIHNHVIVEIQMADNKTEHRADKGKVAEDRKKAPEAGQKGSERTQGGHQETQPSQSGEKRKDGG